MPKAAGPPRSLSRRELLKVASVGAGALAAGGLGARAALAGSPRCRWGAFVGQKGGLTMPAVYEFEDLIERKLAVTRHYIRWNGRVLNGQIKESAASGHVPLVSWGVDRAAGEQTRFADIAGGVYDDLIRSHARAYARWGRKAYFVFNHEPENDVLAGSADEFRAAHERVRDIFVKHGATNLLWVVTLMRPTYEGKHGGPEAWLPDAFGPLGVDGYNRGICDATKGWQSFETIFRAARKYAASVGKRLIVQEWGTVGRRACGQHNPQTKAQWIKQAVETIKSWPEVGAVVYTNHDSTFRDQPVRFRVDRSPASLRAYKHAGHDPYFN